MNFGIMYVLFVYLVVIVLMCSNKFSIATCGYLRSAAAIRRNYNL